jgi:lipoprotein NlpD
MASLWGRRTLVTTVCVASAWALIGCATRNQAPVEDHSAKVAHAAPLAGDANKGAATAPPPAAEPRASTYTVQPGDMLTKIGMDTGQAWRDLARWNSLADPNHLEVGQVLRVVPPVGDVPPGSGVSTTTTTTTIAAVPGAVFKALPPIANKTDAKASGATSTAGSAVPLTGAATPQPAAPRDDDDLTWAWPAAGPVVAPFDDAKTKGLAIGGKAGDPVYAAADGRVVYAGSGLRGYGNLVIVKHNANYLTAYAHNQALLVKEDQIVKRGQKIAEMGSTDADRVQLHFEIRKQGKPIDPTRLLPPR